MVLEMMISDHEGALEMSKAEKTAGQDPDALTLAGAITSSRSAEITQMQNLLKRLLSVAHRSRRDG